MKLSVVILLAVAAHRSHTQEDRRYRTVCYMEGWTHWLQEPNKFEVEDVDTGLCTHVVWNHAELNSSLNIVVHDDGDTAIYARLTGLKDDHPQLKVLLNVGGWTLATEEFSQVAATEASRQAFASEAVDYLRRHNFDGLVMDWEWPVTRAPSIPEDKHHYTQLLQTIMEAFEEEAKGSTPRLLLAAVISPSPWQVRNSFELPDISRHVDWLDVRAFDLHGSWEGAVAHHSALYSPTWDAQDSIDYMMQLIVNSSVPREKLDLGIPFFGDSLNLTDPTNTDLGAPVSGAADTLAYYEICKLLNQNVTSGRLGSTNAPFMVDGTRWTGYDDATSIKEKVDYVMEHGLGGVSVFTIDADDFNGLCGGERSPLLHAVHQQFSGLIG